MSATGERQYQQTLENQRRRPFATAGSSPIVARLLASVRRRSQQLDEIEAAWRAVADPEWLHRTQVASMDSGVARIAVRDKALQYQLSRMEERLARAMKSVSPLLKSLRFVFEPTHIRSGPNGKRFPT